MPDFQIVGAHALWERTVDSTGLPVTPPAYTGTPYAAMIAPNPAFASFGPPFLGGKTINDSGAIVGTATYSGSNTNIASGSHGVLLLPVSICPQTIPTSGVARAKLVFGSGVQVPKLDTSNTTFNITIGGQGVADLYQDDNNNNIFYFSVPAGTAGPADVAISGISVPGMPWLSATPPQTMTLPGLVQYTDDPTKGIKGFSDSNLVNIEEGKSYIDYLNANGGISNDDAVALMSNIREDAATVQMDLWKAFLADKTLDQSAATDLQNQASQKNGDFLTAYPPTIISSGGSGLQTGVQVIATAPDAWMDGPTPGQFTVSRPTSSPSSLTVNYTVGGTGVAGTDYTALSGSVIIPANATKATITLTPIQHSLSGASKTVVVTISTSTSYQIGSANADTVTIHDYNP